MTHSVVSRCPVCEQAMDVTELHCSHCNSTLSGRFASCTFCQLSLEQQEFVEVFLASRGNIKEVERLLGISYPTVRSRLDAVVERIGGRAGARDVEKRRIAVLEALDKGEVSSADAVKLLRSQG